jgi:hypothetical protein
MSKFTVQDIKDCMSKMDFVAQQAKEEREMFLFPSVYDEAIKVLPVHTDGKYYLWGRVLVRLPHADVGIYKAIVLKRKGHSI